MLLVVLSVLAFLVLDGVVIWYLPKFDPNLK